MLTVLRGLARLLSAALAVLLGWYIYTLVPPSYYPWTPIDLKAPVTLFTGYKLSLLEDDLDACTRALDRAEISYRNVPDKTQGECPLTNQIVLDQSLYPYSATVRGSCGLVASLIKWEEQSVRTAAEEHLGSPVESIDHVGIHACRNVRGSQTRTSQHASAKAIDISGFRLEDGSRISVLNDWGNDTPEGRFLKDVHNHSCSIFAAVFGPDYNSLHADHFHLDRGPYNLCR